MSQEPRKPDPREMTNEELCHAWEVVNDHENRTPEDQAILDEMERRHIQY